MASHSPPPARVLTLGGLRTADGSPVSPKPLLIAAYLTLAGSTARTHLAALFVPHADDPADALSTAVRRAGGLVHNDSDTTRLTSACDSDAQVFRTLALNGRAHEALALYGGGFLEGAIPRVGQELEEWCMRTREDLAALAVTANLQLARHALRNDGREEATRYVVDALRHAPPGVLRGVPVDALQRLCIETGVHLPGHLVEVLGGARLRRTRGHRSERRHGARTGRRGLLPGWPALATTVSALLAETERRPLRRRALGIGRRCTALQRS